MEFAQILTNIMKEKNISAYKIAKDTGLSDSLIGYWKNGLKKPNFDNILLLSNYLKVSTDYLLTGKEPKSKKLTEEEQELLALFSKLQPKEQHKLLGRLQAMAEETEGN